MRYCFGGFTAQSAQWCLRCHIYAVRDRICSQSLLLIWAARIKPSVSFFKKPFLSHLQDSSSATSEVCWANSPCRTFSLQLLSFSSFLLLLYSWKFSSNEHFLLQNYRQHPLRAIPSVAVQGFALLLNTLLNTNQPSLPFLSRQIQSGDITSGVKSFPIHADYFLHCAIHDTCIVEYHPEIPILPFPRDGETQEMAFPRP